MSPSSFYAGKVTGHQWNKTPDGIYIWRLHKGVTDSWAAASALTRTFAGFGSPVPDAFFLGNRLQPGRAEIFMSALNDGD